MATGIVKWFNEGKGFGFISCAEKQYFVHFSAIEGQGFKTLHEGDYVEFSPGKNSKGLIAEKVIKI